MYYVNQLSDVPIGSHFAILRFKRTYIPGDERSRTHPGHGYPAHTETSVTYQVFVDEIEWRNEIEHLTLRDIEHVPLRANRARVNVRTVVELED